MPCRDLGNRGGKRRALRLRQTRNAVINSLATVCAAPFIANERHRGFSLSVDGLLPYGGGGRRSGILEIARGADQTGADSAADFC